MEPKNKKVVWNIVQSWWILLNFVIFMNWSSFVYIAIRVKSKRWAIWSVIYTVSCFVGISMVASFTHPSWQTNSGMALLIISWIVCFFHSIIVRKEFLLRLEARALLSRKEDYNLKRQLEDEYGIDFDMPTAQSNQPAPKTTTAKDRVVRQSTPGE
ncbi:hypothetical protein J2T13_002668 [Paenibacillus sp. DS2015]|uniref:hypothetical protein n=1 Tax=Paenibacillus sp. DS2015 TaxID=3373917 RepID=UPI003D1E2F98